MSSKLKLLGKLSPYQAEDSYQLIYYKNGSLSKPCQSSESLDTDQPTFYERALYLNLLNKAEFFPSPMR